MRPPVPWDPLEGADQFCRILVWFSTTKTVLPQEVVTSRSFLVFWRPQEERSKIFFISTYLQGACWAMSMRASPGGGGCS